MDAEALHITRAAASLGDEFVNVDQRLREIEQALKFDPDHDHRRELVREYLDLTDPKRSAA